jgi:diguanylate cyclase (GGDEF)-like protein
MTNIQTSQQMILETKAELEEKNVELLNASITDAMTGAYNRRYFDEMFDKEYKRAIRDKKPYTFFLLDIDFFKQYNDTYGHQAGDQTLIKVAGVLQNNLRRPGDFAFRIGGEEFGGILSNTTTQEAMMITKKILTAIEELHIEHIGNKASKYVTASIGIMSATPSDRIDAKEWIELADEALYDAKDSGRNRVIVSSGERKAPSKKEDNVQIANNQTYIMEKTDEKTQQTMG